MTDEVRKREAMTNEFTWFGATRFTFYIVAGIAFYIEALKVAGAMLIVGSIIGLVRRVVYLTRG